MRETEIVQRIRELAQTGVQNKALLKTIGEDCAILRPNAKEDLVFTSDLLLEGRHFTLETHTAADIGHKALARSLSDLAAMGSVPVFCLVSLAIPAALGARWIQSFYAGLLGLASRYKTALAGGDLARFEHVIVDVLCWGRVPRGKALTRSAARPGDRIFVTGSLGASALGLATRRGPAWRRHLRPEPRIAAGIALRKLGVRAAMDLSDGLSLDLHRLCLESNVSAEIDSPLPLAEGATLEQVLHGGEDYELLFTAPARVRVPQRIARLAITNIGTVRTGKPGEVRLNGRILKPAGYDHFR